MLKILSSKRELRYLRLLNAVKAFCFIFALYLPFNAQAIAIKSPNMPNMTTDEKSYETLRELKKFQESRARIIGISSENTTFQVNKWMLANAVSEDRAIQVAQQEVSGKVLGVRLDPQQQVYHVKILSSDAKVQVVKVDANTGGIVR